MKIKSIVALELDMSETYHGGNSTEKPLIKVNVVMGIMKELDYGTQRFI